MFTFVSCDLQRPRACKAWGKIPSAGHVRGLGFWAWNLIKGSKQWSLVAVYGKNDVVSITICTTLVYGVGALRGRVVFMVSILASVLRAGVYSMVGRYCVGVHKRVYLGYSSIV